MKCGIEVHGNVYYTRSVYKMVPYSPTLPTGINRTHRIAIPYCGMGYMI